MAASEPRRPGGPAQPRKDRRAHRPRPGLQARAATPVAASRARSRGQTRARDARRLRGQADAARDAPLQLHSNASKDAMPVPDRSGRTPPSGSNIPPTSRALRGGRRGDPRGAQGEGLVRYDPQGREAARRGRDLGQALDHGARRSRRPRARRSRPPAARVDAAAASRRCRSRRTRSAAPADEPKRGRRRARADATEPKRLRAGSKG